MPLCEGENIEKYKDYVYDDDEEALEALGCVAPKSKESKGEFFYNTADKCTIGTTCKLGNQCGSKGNTRI